MSYRNWPNSALHLGTFPIDCWACTLSYRQRTHPSRTFLLYHITFEKHRLQFPTRLHSNAIMTLNSPEQSLSATSMCCIAAPLYLKPTDICHRTRSKFWALDVPEYFHYRTHPISVACHTDTSRQSGSARHSTSKQPHFGSNLSTILDVPITMHGHPLKPVGRYQNALGLGEKAANQTLLFGTAYLVEDQSAGRTEASLAGIYPGKYRYDLRRCAKKALSLWMRCLAALTSSMTSRRPHWSFWDMWTPLGFTRMSGYMSSVFDFAEIPGCMCFIRSFADVGTDHHSTP